MDYSQYIIPLITAILSIGTVSAFVAKYATKVVKYVRLSADAINALDNLAEALKDGMIDAAELEKVKASVEKFKADLKS